MDYQKLQSQDYVQKSQSFLKVITSSFGKKAFYQVELDADLHLTIDELVGNPITQNIILDLLL